MNHFVLDGRINDMSKKNISLTEGKINITLLRFAFPFLLASFMQAMYGATDLFVVGQFNDSASVSAVAIGSQLMQTITGIILGISMGGTVLIGRDIGERNDEKTARAVGTLSILFLMIAAILTVVMLFCQGFVTGLLNTPKEAFYYTKQYIFICSCGIPFIVGYNAVSGIFRGIGDSKSPMYFVAIGCVINAAANFILVGIFKLGASGSAFSTIIAQAVSFGCALIIIRKRGFPFPFKKVHFRLDKVSAKYILKVGAPLALQDGLINISFLVITTIINTMGITASASVGVVEKIIIFAMIPPMAFASAVATMTAQNIGAGKKERAIKSLKWGIVYSLAFGIIVCGYLQVFPETITSIFTTDSDVIKSAAMYLQSYSMDCVLVAFIFCMNSYFSGSGKSGIAFLHSMIATLGVRIPMSYAMSQIPNISLYFMGLASPSASIVSLIICTIYFVVLEKKRNSYI